VSAARAEPAHAEPLAEAPAGLWTPTYALLCLSMFFITGHQGLLTPTLPLYVHSLGGSSALIGLLLVLFAVVSVASRPLVGHWSDTRGVVGVLLLGILILAVTGLAHLIPLLWLIAIFGTIRGLGWAAVNTAANTMLAMLAPATRRAEASSYFNIAANAAHGILPAVALTLIAMPQAGFSAVFVLCAALPLLTAPMVLAMRHKIEPGAAVTVSSAPSSGRLTFFDRRVLLPTFLLATVTMTHPASQAFLPLYALERGIPDVSWYYLTNTATGILTLALLGRVFDRVGRAPSIMAGFALCTMGQGLLLVAGSLSTLLCAAVVISVGQAAITSSTMALAIALADPRQRGLAFGTYTSAFSLGQGIGAMLLGLIAQLGGYSAMYVAAILIALTGLGVTAARWSAIGRGAPRRLAAA
jgi:MFS family permease